MSISCFFFKWLHNKLFKTEWLKTTITISCLIISMGQELRCGFIRQFRLAVSWAAVVIWRLNLGWRICFPGGSLTRLARCGWLWLEDSVPLHRGLSTRLLEYPHIWEAGLAQYVSRDKAEAVLSFMTYPLKSHTVTFVLFHWSHTSIWIQCGKELYKSIKNRKWESSEPSWRLVVYHKNHSYLRKDFKQLIQEKTSTNKN